MTEQQIIDEIDLIGLLADTRFEELCDNAPAMAGLVLAHQLLDPQEAARLHELKLALSAQYGHLHTPQAARERILERIKTRRTNKEVHMESKYRSCLMLSADSPEQLRPSDVDRVMSHSLDLGCLEGFRAWLLGFNLNDRTRKCVIDFEPDLEESTGS